MQVAFTATELVTLLAKAALLEEMVAELRLYRGYVTQFDARYQHSNLFATLEAYDAMFGNRQED